MTPRRLEEFPSTGQQRYDWEELLDGSPWELVAGVDFGGKPNTFASNARQQGTSVAVECASGISRRKSRSAW